jgi:hypothetical protein
MSKSLAFAILGSLLVGCGSSETPAAERPGAGDSAVPGDSSQTSETPTEDSAPVEDSSVDPTDTNTQTDGSTTADSGGTTGKGTDPGKVQCGPDLVCETSMDPCCVAVTNSGGWKSKYSCAKTCTGGTFRVTPSCDGPEDCATGEVCCYRVNILALRATAQCEKKASCPGTSAQEAEVCHTAADCGAGKTCKQCSDPQGAATIQRCVSNDRCP